jgi:hypothetical protein
LVPAALPPSTDQRILRWAGRPPSSRVATAPNFAAAPLYADAELILTATGRPSARFALGDSMPTTLTAIPVPYSMYACVTYNQVAPARREVIFERSDGGNYRVGVTAAGNWHMVTAGGATLTGPVAVDGETAVIHFEQTAAGVTAYLNGTAFGSNASVPAAQDFVLSSLASAEDWDGDIYELLFVRFATNSAWRTMLLNYYFDYYGITP